MPDNIAAGNLLIMILGWWGGFTPAGLSGWTQRLIASGTSQRIAYYEKIATGNEATVNVTGFAAADDPRCAVVLQIANHNGYNVGAVTTGFSQTSWTVPAVSSVADNLIIRSVFSQSQTNSVNWSWSGNPIPVADFYSGQAQGWFGHQSVVWQPATGPASTLTVTRSSLGLSDNFAAMTVAIKPDGTGASQWVPATIKVRENEVWVEDTPPTPPPSGAVRIPANVRLRGCNFTFWFGDGFSGMGAEGGMWVNFRWTDWIKPQIDDCAALGVNCLRIWGSPEPTGDGVLTTTVYLNRWQQVLDYCRSKGIYVLPTGGDLGRWGGTDAQNVNLFRAWGELLADYDNVIGVDLANESWARVVDASGRGAAGETSVLNFLGNLKDAVNDSNLPVTISVTGITRASGGWTLDFYSGGANPASRSKFFALSDFNDVHLYDTWTLAEMQNGINSVPALRNATQGKQWLFGEFGTCPSPGPYSNIRTSLYTATRNLILADSDHVGGCNWSLWDYTNSVDWRFGLYGLNSFPPGVPSRSLRNDIASIFSTYPVTR